MLIALHNSKLFTSINDADWPLVADVRWTLQRVKTKKYAQGVHQGQHVLLHRFLLSAPAGARVVHEDGDGLNNRRANLLLIPKDTSREGRRKRVYKGPTGVYMRDGKWRARIYHDGQYLALGIFDSQHEAMQARDYVSIIIRPEFDKLHEVDLTGFDALKLAPMVRKMIVAQTRRPSRSGESRSRP